MPKKKKTKGCKGFTLIELLVVIAIIGLLATIMVVSLNNARSKTRNAKRVADIKQIQVALELFYNDNNEYPMHGTLVSYNQPPLATDGTPAFSTYMVLVPTAPLPKDGTCTDANNGYVYTCYEDAAGTDACDLGTDTGVTYKFTFCLGATTGGLSSGLKTAEPAGIR